MSEFRNMPPNVKAEAERALAGLSSGKVHPFTGPIYDQDGNLRLGVGVRAGDDLLSSLDWLADGVMGELPAKP